MTRGDKGGREERPWERGCTSHNTGFIVIAIMVHVSVKRSILAKIGLQTRIKKSVWTNRMGKGDLLIS